MRFFWFDTASRTLRWGRQRSAQQKKFKAVRLVNCELAADAEAAEALRARSAWREALGNMLVLTFTAVGGTDPVRGHHMRVNAELPP